MLPSPTAAAAGDVGSAGASPLGTGNPHHNAASSNAVPRPLRLRRFSTEYGALCGSALQPQLAQLRLLQAQHCERAADGLVLHDVGASVDACGSDAAVAAAAAAAWGNAVRPTRNRRLSNLSVFSAMSVLSSTSVDGSGELSMAEEESEAAVLGSGGGGEAGGPDSSRDPTRGLAPPGLVAAAAVAQQQQQQQPQEEQL
jgi:hypothetical protein